jgi:hypothetical protein
VAVVTTGIIVHYVVSGLETVLAIFYFLFWIPRFTRRLQERLQTRYRVRFRYRYRSLEVEGAGSLWMAVKVQVLFFGTLMLAVFGPIVVFGLLNLGLQELR